jgi:3-dehydroquinate synthase
MSHKILVATNPAYEVHVGSHLLSSAAQAASRYSKVAVITDSNVGPLYCHNLDASLREHVIEVTAGEASKSFETLERVLDQLNTLGLDRDAALIALGGGVVGDLTGLAASLFKRGIPFIQCATTLLAQVDASVGGKTAVNLPSGKNLAGTFHQPAAVFADVSTLETLPASEFASGLGEVLKTALLAGEDAISALERDSESILDKNAEALARTVKRCVEFKAEVVAEDPLESGRRKCLNLGHTFAHAIEHIAGFGVIPHGVAVAVGIGMAFEQAIEKGVLRDGALADRSRALTAKLGLPTCLAEVEEAYRLRFPADAMRASMASDKKNHGNQVMLVLPVRAGEVALDVPL